MKITGNKQADTVITLGIVGAGLYAGYKILNSILDRVTPPTGQNPNLAPGCNIGTLRQIGIRQAMDQIYTNLNGPNFFLYPDEVNVLLGYDLCELQYANTYYMQTYGTTLYNQISGEWDIQNAYDAAENYLIQNGLGN